MQFTYVSDSWQWDRRRNARIFFGSEARGLRPPVKPGPFSPAAFRRGTKTAPFSSQSALIRAASRDNLRDTVFLWSTPLVIARCSSGWASRKADRAVSLSPLAIAVSTFLTKVRTRLTRARLIAVRLAACQIRFSADLWLAMHLAVNQRRGLYRDLVRDVNHAVRRRLSTDSEMGARG